MNQDTLQTVKVALERSLRVSAPIPGGDQTPIITGIGPVARDIANMIERREMWNTKLLREKAQLHEELNVYKRYYMASREFERRASDPTLEDIEAMGVQQEIMALASAEIERLPLPSAEEQLKSLAIERRKLDERIASLETTS